MRDGKFPPGRAIGGQTMWLEAEVTSWILAQPFQRLKKPRGKPAAGGAAAAVAT
jgi:hypothetical protein